MTKPKTKSDTPVLDIEVPAFDTPEQSMTPIVLAAMKDDGAISRPHETDTGLIVLTFKDEAKASAFAAAIDGVLNPTAE